MSKMMKSCRLSWLCPVVLAGVALAEPVLAKSDQVKGTQPEKPPANAAAIPRHSHFPARGLTPHATMYYQAAWGIDNLLVRKTASGSLVRFSYRVTDAERASPLGQKEATPQLIDPKRGVALQIPVMEKVGQLRQTGSPVALKEYWMAFSNKGDVVKAGDRVDVVIGVFRAEGLVVE